MILAQGTGEPALVFLHYFGGSAQTWLPLIELLANHVRCVAPDLRGFGAAELTAAPYGMADYADDLDRLLQHLCLARYILVGHSMGGKIALTFAMRQPPGLQSLVLIAPSPPTPEPMPAVERARLLHTHGERAAAEATAHKITVKPLTHLQFEQVVIDNLRSSGAAWQGWLNHGSREDVSKFISQITVPVLVVVGEADPVLSPQLIEAQVVQGIPKARLVLIPGAGHLLPLEDPEALAQYIRQILTSSASVNEES